MTKQNLAEKILLHLANCLDFGASYTFQKKTGISGNIFRDLAGIKTNDFRDSITELKKSQFVEKKRQYDGSILVSLTERGRLRALNIKFKELGRKKGQWDNRWRLIAFDIPEELRKGRNALRYKMKTAGFYELQKSLFLYPYDCKKEVGDLVKLFRLEKYVRFATSDFIDIQDQLKHHFKLS